MNRTDCRLGNRYRVDGFPARTKNREEQGNFPLCTDDAQRASPAATQLRDERVDDRAATPPRVEASRGQRARPKSRAHRRRREERRLGDNKDLRQRNGKIRGDFDEGVGGRHCYSLRDRGGFVPKGTKSRRALKKHDMAASHTPKNSEKPSIRPISVTDSGGIERPRTRTRCSIRSPKKKRIEYDTKTRNAARPMA
jgi:hypothetical protein